MRLFKLFTGGLVVAIIGLFIKQNLATFQKDIPFTFDLYIREPMTWAHHLYAIIFASGLLGLVLGVLLMLKPFINARRGLAEERHDKEECVVELDQQKQIAEETKAEEAPTDAERPSQSS